MAVVSGTDGKVLSRLSTQGSSQLAEIAGIDTWQLNVSVRMRDVTPLGELDTESRPMSRSASVQISGTYQTAGEQQEFFDNLSSTSTGVKEFRLKLWGSTSLSDYYVVDGYFNRLSNTGNAGSKRSFNGTLKASGGFRRTT